MPNEVHRKILVTEAAITYGTNWANIDSLPDGDMTWCAPVTSMEDCDYCEVFAAISSGGTAPDGTVEFYVGRKGTNLQAGDGFGGTLTASGVEATLADAVSMAQELGPPVKVLYQDQADKVYTCSFRVWYPGASFLLFIFNRTGEALDGTASPHSVYGRGWGPEIQ
jgi:hypothetical protein